jgi:hypothetical protein
MKCLPKRRYANVSDDLIRHWAGSAYHGHVLVVAEKNPELDESEGANPSNGEESNPLNAHGDTQTETRKDQPEPPAQLESLGRTKLVLVGEARKGKNCECGRGDEGGIKKNQASLGKKAVLCT